MAGVEKVTGVCQVQPSVGYLTHLYIFHSDLLIDQDNWSEALQRSLTTLKLPNGSVVYDIRAMAKQMTFRELPQQTADGLSVAVSIEATYRGTEGVFDWTKGQQKRRWGAIFRDTLGQCYMAGIGFNGFKMVITHNVTERNGFNLTLTGLFVDRPWRIINTDIDLIIAAL